MAGVIVHTNRPPLIKVLNLTDDVISQSLNNFGVDRDLSTKPAGPRSSLIHFVWIEVASP